jgi:transcriptional regulator NrdR family protein
MKNINPWIVCFVISILFLQTLIGFYFENSRLRWALQISEKSKSIADDQIQELIYAANNLKSEKEAISTQSFVAGIMDAIKNKDSYSAIWHEGYNRGEIVAQYASEIKAIDEPTQKSANHLPQNP